MSRYKYGTLLRATRDDPHPDNDTEEGDLYIEPGKLEDGDSYTVLTQEHGPVKIDLEVVEIYEADSRMGSAAMQRYVRDRAVEDGYTDEGESQEAEA